MTFEVISSAQNPKVKELLSLREKSSLRREKSLFIVEGRREIGHALEAGFKARTLFFCPPYTPGWRCARALRACWR